MRLVPRETLLDRRASTSQALPIPLLAFQQETGKRALIIVTSAHASGTEVFFGVRSFSWFTVSTMSVKENSSCDLRLHQAVTAIWLWRVQPDRWSRRDLYGVTHMSTPLPSPDSVFRRTPKNETARCGRDIHPCARTPIYCGSKCVTARYSLSAASELSLGRKLWRLAKK